MPDLRDDVRQLFAAITGHQPDGLWSAPGRLTVLGGEGDDDLTLSFAIDRRTIVAAGAREDPVIRVVSTLFDQAIEVPLAELDGVQGSAGWADYPLGVAWALGRTAADLAAVPGVDLVIESNVPVGAGLGSSAALECAVALALDDLWRLGMSRPDLAAAARLAETGFVGMPSGPADRYAALLGHAGSAVLLDGRRLDIEMVDLGLAAAGLTFLVIEADVPSHPSESDDERVRDAVRVLREHGPTALGPLLDDHRALGAELALAVETAREHGALGARGMTGGAIALTPLGAVSRIQVAIHGAFAEHGFAAPEVYAVRPSDAAARDA